MYNFFTRGIVVQDAVRGAGPHGSHVQGTRLGQGGEGGTRGVQDDAVIGLVGLTGVLPDRNGGQALVALTRLGAQRDRTPFLAELSGLEAHRDTGRVLIGLSGVLTDGHRSGALVAATRLSTHVHGVGANVPSTGIGVPEDVIRVGGSVGNIVGFDPVYDFFAGGIVVQDAIRGSRPHGGHVQGARLGQRGEGGARGVQDDAVVGLVGLTGKETDRDGGQALVALTRLGAQRDRTPFLAELSGLEAHRDTGRVLIGLSGVLTDGHRSGALVAATRLSTHVHGVGANVPSTGIGVPEDVIRVGGSVGNIVGFDPVYDFFAGGIVVQDAIRGSRPHGGHVQGARLGQRGEGGARGVQDDAVVGLVGLTGKETDRDGGQALVALTRLGAQRDRTPFLAELSGLEAHRDTGRVLIGLSGVLTDGHRSGALVAATRLSTHVHGVGANVPSTGIGVPEDVIRVGGSVGNIVGFDPVYDFLAGGVVVQDAACGSRADGGHVQRARLGQGGEGGPRGVQDDAVVGLVRLASVLSDRDGGQALTRVPCVLTEGNGTRTLIVSSTFSTNVDFTGANGPLGRRGVPVQIIRVSHPIGQNVVF